MVEPRVHWVVPFFNNPTKYHKNNQYTKRKNTFIPLSTAATENSWTLIGSRQCSARRGGVQAGLASGLVTPRTSCSCTRRHSVTRKSFVESQSRVFPPHHCECQMTAVCFMPHWSKLCARTHTHTYRKKSTRTVSCWLQNLFSTL